MKISHYLPLVALLVLTSCGGDERAVQALFDDYKSALATKDYGFICSSLDGKTIRMFQEMAELARTADSMRLARSALFVRYEVILFRQRLEKEVLENLSWEDVCRIGTLTMEIGEEVLNSQLGVSKFKDSQAVYSLIIDGKHTEQFLFFIEEDGDWKVNAAKFFSMLSYDSVRMSFFAKPGDKALHNKGIERQVENVTGQPLKANIWNPPASW